MEFLPSPALCRGAGRWSARLRLPIAAAALAAGAVACEVPSTPKWDVRFRIPVDTLKQTNVAEVLPADVQPTPDGTAFEVGLQNTFFSRSLGELCPQCPFGAAPVVTSSPGFEATLSGGINLPSDVVAVALAGGTITVTITNTLSFDPLRPPNAASPGALVITVRSGTVQLAKDSVGSATTALPPNGGVLTRAINVQPGLVTQGIAVEVKIVSPPGGPVTLDRNQRISVVAEGTNARVSEASVRVTNRAVEREQIIVDLSEIDQSVRDRVQSGAFLIETTNPFNVEGPFDVRIGVPGRTINLDIVIPAGPGTDTVEVPLSRDDLRAILGQENVVVEAEGTLSSVRAPGYAVVRPGQVFIATAYFEIVLRVPED